MPRPGSANRLSPREFAPLRRRDSTLARTNGSRRTKTVICPKSPGHASLPACGANARRTRPAVSPCPQPAPSCGDHATAPPTTSVGARSETAREWTGTPRVGVGWAGWMSRGVAGRQSAGIFSAGIFMEQGPSPRGPRLRRRGPHPADTPAPGLATAAPGRPVHRPSHR